MANLGLWGAGMKRMVAGGIGRPSRKRWFWMLKKYAPRVFASWKPKLQKKHLAIDGLAAAAAECKREMLAGWRRKECAGGREAWGSGLLTGQDGNKDAACWKMCTSYFRVWKIRAYFFLFAS